MAFRRDERQVTPTSRQTQVMAAVAHAPFMCVLGPFLGDSYTLQCPQCTMGLCYSMRDGAQLRERPLWKMCELGHKFLVCLDAADAGAELAACVADGAGMPSDKKRPRVGMSRAEMLASVDTVRKAMGVVAAVDMRAAAGPALCRRAKSPPLPSTLMRLVAAPERVVATPSGGGGGGGGPRSGRARPGDISDDEEDVDIDAALRTLDDIAAESAAAEPSDSD